MSGSADVKYYAMIDGERVGPVSLDELVAAGVLPDTYIWHKGLPKWIHAKDDGDICRHFRQSLSEAMHPVLNSDSEVSDPFEESPVQQSADEAPDWIELEKPDLSKPPRSYILASIVVTLLCFPPTGLIALWMSAESRRKWRKGLAEESHEYARRARMLVGITFFLGFIAIAILSLRF